MGRASTVFNTARQLGSAVGVALLTTVISAVGVTHVVNGHQAPNLAAFHWAFGVGAILALCASLFAWQINDTDAAATMKPRKKPQPADEAELAPAV
jgi:hypothetical protein